MKYPSLLAGIGLAVLALLASTTVVLGKEGMRASLTTPIPSRAAPGDEILLAWTLTVVDGNMQSQPFSAEYVFVQLLSPTREATIAFATGGDHARGEYAARVKVPAGGIAAIQFGIRGTTDSIIPLDGEVSIPAAATKSVPASPNAAAGVPPLGSLLGLICLAGLSVVGIARRLRAPSVAPSLARQLQRSEELKDEAQGGQAGDVALVQRRCDLIHVKTGQRQAPQGM